MKHLVIASALTVCALSSQAQALQSIPAANPNYFEIGFTSVKFEEDSMGYSIKTTPDALRGVLGRDLNDNVALEAMFGVGLGRSNIDVSGASLTGANFKINSMYGVYVTPKAVLSDNFEGLLRLGYAYAKGSMSYNGQSASDSDNGFSYGVGLRYHFDKSTFLNVDYMSYLHKSDYKATGYSVGLGFRF